VIAQRTSGWRAGHGPPRRKAAGVKIIIAGAGSAAHLPGVTAALTPLPVFGVPIESKLSGVDSLYSIVQMPVGIPVGTLAPTHLRAPHEA
jgi:5-(carboxyamino)imidazole ribonucleotide mutase